MAAPLFVGGITRLHRTSTVTAYSSGVTFARTKSGPIVNSGLGRDARKIWPSATVGAAARTNTATQARRIRGAPQAGLGWVRRVRCTWA